MQSLRLNDHQQSISWNGIYKKCIRIKWVFKICAGDSSGDPVFKNPPCNAGDPGFDPSQEDPLEKGMAIHSSILA